MPDKDGQVTKEDFKAPKEQFRIIKEDMDDGELIIIGDYYDENMAIMAVICLVEENDYNFFTLWDDQGNEICIVRPSRYAGPIIIPGTPIIILGT